MTDSPEEGTLMFVMPSATFVSIRRGYRFFLSEWKTLARFLAVGGTSFGVKALSYIALSRFVWVTGSRHIQNAIALVVATLYNYLLHRFWTFRHQRPAAGSGRRYAAVLVFGTALDITLFYVFHSIVGLYDVVSLALTSLVIACCTFTLHRFWTFHENPWRKGVS